MEKPPIPIPENNLGALIGRTGKVMARALIARMREAGHDINIDHFIVLVHLWEQDGQHQRELGETAGRSKTTVTRAIDSLEKQNMVVRIPDQQDRRHKRIYLTQKGKDFQQTLMPHSLAVQAEATHGISEVDMEVCRRVLQQIFYNLQKRETQ